MFNLYWAPVQKGFEIYLVGVLGVAREIFNIEKKLAMSNVLIAPQKKRRGVGASCLVIIC